MNFFFNYLHDYRNLSSFYLHGLWCVFPLQAEEKLRVLYDQKRRRLRHLEERCAEARKVGPTEVLVRKLSTKIKVAIQVVDSISNRISKLRDEELWPQLAELIQGYVFSSLNNG